MRPPDFWRRDGWAARLLAPAGWIYTAAARRRTRQARPFTAPVPVICIGNLTTGGSGKTPIAIAIAEHLIAHGRRVAFLTRGYGGSLAGPIAVDPLAHDAGQVGDEPLLLAAVAPTIVARHRPAGAESAVRAGADVIVMDDGLQNPTLVKSLRIVVIDGETGFGNGRVLPAGPLRVPVAQGLAEADLFVLMGEDRVQLAGILSAHAPLVRARLRAANAAQGLRGRRVVAFAGIGRPEKFFATLQALGAEVIETAAFADHHRYRDAEIERLAARARAVEAQLVTTAKDHVRLPRALRAGIAFVPVHAVFDDPAPLHARIARCLDA
jgi:tetraacyldisaccharide 4'-kinase